MASVEFGPDKSFNRSTVLKLHQVRSLVGLGSMLRVGSYQLFLPEAWFCTTCKQKLDRLGEGPNAKSVLDTADFDAEAPQRE